MPRKKENFLDKIVKKNYDSELEKILETKNFDEKVKNILLEILYKIEIAYKDYKTVKRDVETKEKYISKIINIIDKECEEIQLVTIDSQNNEKIKDKTFIVEKENKKIICYPIERKLLYCIAKIGKSSNLIKEEDNLISNAISNTINIGNNINMVEPLRNFNGWSWSIIKNEIENIEYNLIYQNLRILVGNTILEEWLENQEYIVNYYDILKNELEEKYSNQIKEKFILQLEKLSILIDKKLNPRLENDIKEEIEKTKELLEKFNNKQKYIQEITDEKNEIKKKIKEIDRILMNKSNLEDEYRRRNEKLPLEKNIFSIKVLAQILTEEKDKLKDKLEDKNTLINPSRFIREKERLERKYKILEDSEIEKELLTLQQVFLEAYLLKIDNAKTKEEIIDLIYNFRYYQMIPFNKEISIYENYNMQSKLYEVEEKILKKAIEYKIINENTKKEIFHYIFITKIINLEQIYIKIKKNSNKIIIELSENSGNAYDEKFEINKEENNEDNIFRSYKNGYRFKLFN